MPVNPLEPNARLYEAMDLIALSRDELVNLVKKQPSKWPIHLKLNAKTNMRTLRLALLDPYNGFTTTEPHKPAGFVRDSAATIVAVHEYFVNRRGTVPDALPPPPVESPHASLTMNPAEPPPYAMGPSGFIAVEDSDVQKASFNGFDFLFLTDSLDKVLSIYIEDLRFQPSMKSTADLPVTMGGFLGDQTGVWIMRSRELIMKIQESNCRVYGSGLVKVGVADFTRPEYTRIFIEAPVPQLAITTPDPVYIAMPASANSSLTVRVFGDNVVHMGPPPYSLEFVASHSSAEGSNRRRSLRLTAEQSAQVVSKLTAIAHSRAGSNRFYDARHTPLQNSEIPGYWSFAAKFYNDYYKKDCSTITDEEALIVWQKITAQCIYGALDLGQGTVNQAIVGHRLVEKYTVGLLASAEVEAELAMVRTPPHGRSKLLKFLSAWDAAHRLLATPSAL